jgi:hypothetical protein
VPEAVLWDRPDVLALRASDAPRVAFDVPAPVLEAGGSRFAWRDLDVRLAVPGAHNARNAAAALEACRLAGADPAAAVAALADFAGAGRRFERLGTTPSGATVVDDYAHHPTEVAATIAAARTLGPRRVVAVFQPHLYSRTQRLAAAFGAASPWPTSSRPRRLPGARARRGLPRRHGLPSPRPAPTRRAASRAVAADFDDAERALRPACATATSASSSARATSTRSGGRLSRGARLKSAQCRYASPHRVGEPTARQSCAIDAGPAERGGRRHGLAPGVPTSTGSGTSSTPKRSLHAAGDLAREATQLGGRAGAAIGERERVLGGDRDALRVAVAAREARALDEPRGRGLHAAVASGHAGGALAGAAPRRSAAKRAASRTGLVKNEPALTESGSAGSSTMPLPRRSARTASRTAASGARPPSSTPSARASSA